MKHAVQPPIDVTDGWFSQALDLDERGMTDDALDMVYDKIDEWMRLGRFTECGSFLSRLKIEDLPVRMLLAIAIQTRPASDRVPYRKEFFERAWKTLESRGKDADKLLGRLRNALHVPPAERP